MIDNKNDYRQTALQQTSELLCDVTPYLLFFSIHVHLLTRDKQLEEIQNRMDLKKEDK